MTAMLLAPLYLPVLHLVTLATLPATALYALAGLLLSPLLIPLLMVKAAVNLAIMTPLLLLVSPVAIPVGFFVAAGCLACRIMKAFWIVFTPLLWPLYFFCKWCTATMCIAKIIITDTIFPFLVPLRFSILAAMLPRALTH